MHTNVRYSKEALRQLKKLDIATAKRIVLKIKDNAAQKDPLARAKPLHGVLAGKYRYRIGDYRAIFVFDAKGILSLLTILSVNHRKDIYR